MNKSEIVAKVAGDAGISKAAAEKAVDAFAAAVTATLKKGGKVSLVGFGTFSTSKRKARKGRNPKTGEAISIPATRVPRFSAGKGLKVAVKKK
jgi:DNA-binding protein HU-beta